jgi:hypothetical protein
LQITRFPLLFLLCLLLVTACSKPAQNVSTPTELVPTATFSPLSPFIPADQGTPSFSRGELVNQWALWAGPLIENARRQPTCGSLNAQGDVWFLPDNFFVAAEQGECRIPAGSYLFFPIIMTESAFYDPQVNCPKGQMREEVIHVTLTDLYATVDDFALDNPFDYRASSLECYSIDEDAPDTVSDGYWVLVKPLEPGAHLIRTGYTGDNPGQELSQRYRIVVEQQP